MTAHLPLATTAALVADPARAAMLLALLDGRALAAGELARCAGVSAQSASMHLAQLLQSGFVEVASQGRHRYYRIASADVAHAIEALGVISSPRKLKPLGENESIRFARTCYDHIAGELGVVLADFLERKEFIRLSGKSEYSVTLRGEEFLEGWGIEIDTLRHSRKILARPCLDWTQRRYHVAGALGAAMYQAMLRLGWIRRSRENRILHLTPSGRKQLGELMANGSRAHASCVGETSACGAYSS